MADTPRTIRIAMVIFPDLTLLDLIGPHQVLSGPPPIQVDLLWHRIEPVTAQGGVQILPTATFAEYGTPDVLFIPGGPGQMAAMEDEALIDFVARAGAEATFVTSVCTGALILGAAGLLKGKRAATHWMSMDQLPLLGAEPVQERVVEDGNIITGGGVTAGIDFGLTLLARLLGDDVAKRVQLGLEYDPQPPFDCGSPRTAEKTLRESVLAQASGMLRARREISARIGRERLGIS